MRGLICFIAERKGYAVQSQEQELVTNWARPEEAYDAGDRRWFPTTEEFYYEMLEVLPPCEVARAPSHGFTCFSGVPLATLAGWQRRQRCTGRFSR